MHKAEIIRNDIDTIRAKFPWVARDLAERGFVATVTVHSTATPAACQLYETKRGGYVYIAGSRSLADRFIHSQMAQNRSTLEASERAWARGDGQ
jgi:hypothetical protein